MVCPYLKRGFMTAKCTLTGQVVNLKKMPCLKNYEECPIYKAHVTEKIKEVKEEVEKREAKKEEQPQEVPGVSCEDCLYYSRITHICIRLKQRVDDPKRPPCGGKYFRKAEV
ncbi:hypothetical protein EYM_04460 [Ignicoccus islandicus DSM 13165]|uniref:Uncharacterized protein n=1 Tax=Ignicoccus islandicus DSM 13165 TaxID=940295 RepID=A0A0U2MB04_9CREN|nr:hypothetical protein [Ignicoccus islandicus]ALU12493.1 hypothetical protein EYM_04460 [Ignicoccus islandicus DSM 13165]